MAQEMDAEGKLVSMIMEANEYVRYAAVCNNDAQILWESHRNFVNNILTEEETKSALKRSIEAWKNRDELANKIGKGRYAIEGYDKIKRITIPLDNSHLLFISLDNTPLQATKGKSYGHLVEMGKIMSIVDFVNENQ